MYIKNTVETAWEDITNGIDDTVDTILVVSEPAVMFFQESGGDDPETAQATGVPLNENEPYTVTVDIDAKLWLKATSDTVKYQLNR